MKKIFGTKGFQWYDILSLVFLGLGVINWFTLGIWNLNLVTKIVGYGILPNILYVIISLSSIYGLFAVYKLNK